MRGPWSPGTSGESLKVALSICVDQTESASKASIRNTKPHRQTLANLISDNTLASFTLSWSAPGAPPGTSSRACHRPFTSRGVALASTYIASRHVERSTYRDFTAPQWVKFEIASHTHRRRPRGGPTSEARSLLASPLFLCACRAFARPRPVDVRQDLVLGQRGSPGQDRAKHHQPARRRVPMEAHRKAGASWGKNTPAQRRPNHAQTTQKVQEKILFDRGGVYTETCGRLGGAMGGGGCTSSGELA